MRAAVRAQPNIALVKYWGKRDTERNLPAVGSISITLADLFTTMDVAFDDALAGDSLVVNGQENRAMLPRVSRCLDSVAGADRSRAAVVSESNFPIAAGLASSASAFAALVVAADAAAGAGHGREQLANLAGMASGSAARSIYGGFVELANEGDHITVSTLCAAEDWPLTVVVAITASGPKAVGSTRAMETSRDTSPFYARWVEQQPVDLDEARAAIGARDFARLADVAEHNCLKMHSVMWASRPPVVYWNDPKPPLTPVGGSARSVDSPVRGSTSSPEPWNGASLNPRNARRSASATWPTRNGGPLVAVWPSLVISCGSPTTPISVHVSVSTS